MKTLTLGVLGRLSIDCDACVPVMFPEAMKQQWLVLSSYIFTERYSLVCFLGIYTKGHTRTETTNRRLQKKRAFQTVSCIQERRKERPGHVRSDRHSRASPYAQAAHTRSSTQSNSLSLAIEPASLVAVKTDPVSVNTGICILQASSSSVRRGVGISSVCE